MPKYTSISPYDLILGDLHHGVNASVAGVTDRDGEAVVLEPGQIIDVPEGIHHAFLVDHDADSHVVRGESSDKKAKPTRGDSSSVADLNVSEETTTVTDSATN